MKDLLKYFRNYKKESILGPFFKLLEATFELLVPLLIAHLVDQLIPRQDQGGIFGLVGLLFVFAGFGVLVAITAQYYSSKAAVGYTKELTNDLYEKILSLSKEQRDRLTTSSLVTRLTSDTYQIQTGINLFLRLFLRAPIVVFGSIFMAFTISPQLTLWFIGMVALLTLIIVLMSRLVNPLYARIRKITDRMVTITRQQLQGMRVIRAFGQASHEEAEFNEVNQDYTKWQLVVSKWSSLISPLTFLVVNGTLICILWQGQASIQMGTLSQGMLVALVNYLLQILTELLKLAMLVTSLNQSYIAAGRIVQVFEEKSEELDQELDDVSVSDPQLALQIQDLVFTYPLAAKPSLEGIHLSLNKGQTLGIIGGTGAGKSTLVQLLGHLYEASKGSLTIFKDGENPKTLRQWRDWVAVVPQKAELFKGSIRSNLTLGLNEEQNEEQLWWALGVAQAADFVREKEGGLEAPVEAFGRNFSGGQRQRLTIARAVLRQAPFLVLDDSTSALDYLTEARLLQALKEELTETSLILISQRTNSLRSAEQILILDKGRQVGLGSHEDLVATNPLYQEIHFSQQKREEGAE
ncbi:ABC transporter ATP-binding protein [Streptococcus xiaochunlingii]|uniref:ABC transporter ATP-binding protein n=1 Tax=Streptococcus xiaochunlingii TaxID=2589788 RepID=A0ABY2YE12_9STRE|nr:MULTISPECIES: ABC transporter ATP-binding protein [Streptococcus]MCF4965011.1 ABC transporter ATP-binding protein [Streptococcus sp. GS001]MCG5642167.1 ABC transporter ATP-binding protein/permease [Streptococcus sp. DFI.7.26]MDK8387326.1 ABC transporter ATP-binding protein [Streptococcus xiaochunlingii]MDK8778924.1 ABC transporter ATP-binding protein [Streptococcus xiaochunlingii]TPE37966.1 ABC transporter ATP-binding protein [Streptococcus xiaochunlingii]